MKPIRILSIRIQLLLWLLIPIVLLGIFSSLATYYLAIDFANDAYDEALADSARALASRMHYLKNDRIGIDLPEAAKAILEYDNEDKFFYQVIGPRGRLIAGEQLPLAAQKTQDKLRFWSTQIRDQQVRVATLKISISPAYPAELVTIHVAETLEGRNRLRFEIFTNVILIQLLFIVLSVSSIWIGVARGLISLEKIRKALMQRSPLDLTPLSESTIPTEIKPLTQAINDLMLKVENDLTAQRRFVANAAHQLRTPISGLKVQTELLIQAESDEERKHAQQQVQISVERAAHLAHQLLSLARSEPSIIGFEKFQRFDLAKLARKVTRQFVPQALNKQIDLGYEGEKTQIFMQGDSTSIGELISNLVENAVKYCHSGDQITVSVLLTEQHIEFCILDTGPGIPPEERERVFERFYRVLGNEADGSGLGLSIVCEIAQAHQAIIHLSEGQNGMGTHVRVLFPPGVIISQKHSA